MVRKLTLSGASTDTLNTSGWNATTVSSVHLRIILWTLRNTNKHFWRRCRGTVAVVIFEPSLPMYLFFYLFFSFIPSSISSLYYVTPLYPPIIYFREWVLRDINLSKTFHDFWLWTWSWHHRRGSRTNLLWSRNLWSLQSFARVRGTVFVLGNPKHVRKPWGGSCSPFLS